LDLDGMDRLIPVFYGRPRKEVLAGIKRRVEARGFQLEWMEQKASVFTVGGFVAERVETS
jgi:hypothetical protein